MGAIKNTMKIDESLQRVSTAMRMGEFPQAEKLLIKIIRTDPDFVPAFILLGNLYGQSGRYNDAKKMLLRAIKMDNDNGEAFNNLGVIYMNTGEHRKSLDCLKKALKCCGERADIHYNLGNVYKELDNFPEAAREYDHAIDLDESFIPSYINQGLVYEAQGKFENAAATYQKGLEKDANNPKLRYNLGTIYKAEGRLEEAGDEFRRVLRSQAGWLDAKNNLGVVYHELGRHKKAVKIFNEILEQEPNDVKVLNNLGVSLSKLERNDQAGEAYRKAVKLDPEYTVAVKNLAGLLEEQGNIPEAQAEYEKILQRNPKDPDARYNLGKILYAGKQYEKSMEQFERVIDIQGDHVGALQYMGNASIRTNDDKKARKYFGRLQAINPEYNHYNLESALAWKDKKDYDKAILEIQSHLKSHPNDYEAILLFGELLGLKGDREKAVDVFLKATRMKPDAGEGFFFLAKTYREMGRIQEAIDTAEKLITLQGARADSDDLDRLHGSLDLYEVVVSEYEKDFKEVWMKNLHRLGRTEEGLEENGRKEEPFALDQMPLLEEDSIPIIQIGGLEPVFVVEEEEESLSLEEEEEDGLSVEVSTDGHIPFQNLIDREQSRLPPVGETPAPRQPEAAGGIPLESPSIPPEPPPAGQPPPYIVVAPAAAPSTVSMPPPIMQSAPAPSMGSPAMASLKNSIDTQRGMLEQVQQDIKDLTESLKQEQSPEDADETAAGVSEVEPEIAIDDSEETPDSDLDISEEEPELTIEMLEEAPELEPVEDEQEAALETVSEAAEEPSMLEELDEEAAAPGLEISEEEPELLEELFGEEPESSMELLNDADAFPIEELTAETQDQAVDSTAPETVIQEIKLDKTKTAGLLDYLVKLTDALPDSNHQSFLKSTIKSKTELIIASLLKEDRRGS